MYLYVTFAYPTKQSFTWELLCYENLERAYQLGHEF